MIDNLLDILLKLMPFWQVVLLLLGWAVMHFFYTRIRPLEEEQKKQGNQLNRLTAQNEIQGGAIDKITVFLGFKYKSFIDVYGMKKSSRQLNPTGIELFNELKGKDFLETYKQELFERIDKHKPATAYDVEQAAFFACVGASNTPIFNDYKLFVYNAPLRTIWKEEKETKHEVTLDEVCFVLSIPLRDMYLSEHPEVLR